MKSGILGVQVATGAVEGGGMASGSSSNSESLLSAEVLLTVSHCRQFMPRLALPCCARSQMQ